MLQIGKCVVKHIPNKGVDQPVLVITEPLKVVYTGLTDKIGDPTEVTSDIELAE